MYPSKVVGNNSCNEIGYAGFFGNLIQYSLKLEEYFNQDLGLIFGFATCDHK